MKAFTLEQLNLFGWFLGRIKDIDFIRIYCLNNGFEDIIVLADKLEAHMYYLKNRGKTP